MKKPTKTRRPHDRNGRDGRSPPPSSLRLRREVVTAFRGACEQRGEKAAAVLVTLLEEYLGMDHGTRTRLHASLHERVPPESATRGRGVAYSCRLPPEMLDRLDEEAEKDGRSPLNIIEWVMAFWSLPDGDGTLSSAVTL